MFKSLVRRFAHLALLVPVLMLSLSMSSPRPAQAANTQCVPAIVEYLPGQLLVQCNSVNFLALLSAPGCTSQTPDTLKAWLSLTQAALLSGKTVNIYNASCGGQNLISAIDIIR